ncbi:MAG: threonine synthase [Treponema sp.]|nr:threonine synthase [Treponema sp.]MDY5758328.1 threonine synthase [Treponema sp.]MDY5818304.1 threonine synthase [Treponema sp.]
MQFTSTRNSNLKVSFSQAVRDCIPDDGGVFVPSSIEDMRRWIYYIDETTSFASIAGSLTSALMHEEFSPIICETIATAAFPVEPVVKQLGGSLFMTEMYHGFTGCHRDYGVSYLVSYLETTLQLKGGKAVFLDFTHGGLGALLSKILKGKKNIKAVLVYQKGTVRGLDEESLVWNGGNIYPVEMEGSEAEIKAAISEVFADREFVQTNGLTVANTTNVCRLLGQIFFFPYSFAQVKKKFNGEFYYAMGAGNYGSLMAGLYSWRFALPVNGFYVPSTTALARSANGSPVVLDSLVDLKVRGETNPAVPANLERLESFFGKNEMMMRNFIYPCDVSEEQRDAAAKELYMKYGIFADKETASAYAVVKENCSEVFDEDGAFILTAYNHPSLSSDYCRHVIGEAPEMPDEIKASFVPVELKRPVVSNASEIRKIIEGLWK